MPYEKSHADWIKSEAKFCFCCKQAFVGREYREVHSKTGFHFMLDETESGRQVFRVTTIPEALDWMNVEYFELENEFRITDKYAADAVVVHHHCHVEVNLIALQLCRERVPDFQGNTPLPRYLNEATNHFLTYRLKYADILNLNNLNKHPR